MASDLDKLIQKTDSEVVTGGPVTFATTGLIGLDWALGGGIARGRLIEFSGLESSGKSTIGLQTAIAEAARTGIPALWLDYEYAWEPTYVAGLMREGSVDNAFKVAQPVSVEKGFELATSALTEGWVSSVWFDSTGAMESELKGTATRARAMAQELPALNRAVAKAQAVCGFISQTREVFDTGFGGGWGQGPKRKATGGSAIKFYFSQRAEFSMIRKLKGKGKTITGAEEDGVIGRRVRAKVIKNKVAVPYREMDLDVIDGHGFDQMAHLLELAVEVDVVKRSGAYYEIPGLPSKVQGFYTAVALLRDPRADPVVSAMRHDVITELADGKNISPSAVEDVLVDEGIANGGSETTTEEVDDGDTDS